MPLLAGFREYEAIKHDRLYQFVRDLDHETGGLIWGDTHVFVLDPTKPNLDLGFDPFPLLIMLIEAEDEKVTYFQNEHRMVMQFLKLEPPREMQLSAFLKTIDPFR